MKSYNIQFKDGSRATTEAENWNEARYKGRELAKASGLIFASCRLVRDTVVSLPLFPEENRQRAVKSLEKERGKIVCFVRRDSLGNWQGEYQGVLIGVEYNNGRAIGLIKTSVGVFEVKAKDISTTGKEPLKREFPATPFAKSEKQLLQIP